MSEITGHEYPLLKILSSDFEYHIPAYQRPYAWTTEETNTLFDDLYGFFTSESENENYFLGSIVLIKENTDRKADVIDGQQRLTTLTILFSVLADNFTNPTKKSSCMKRLQEEGDELAGIESLPRLFLRAWDQDFFNKYIQNVRITDLLKIDPATLDTEAKRHIQENCRALSEKFKETFHRNEAELLKFSNFLLNRCYLVVVSTPSQTSAFRVFSVMNSRGLNLLPTDIIKSETIGKLPANLQQTYTDKWEELENQVGRDGFNEVFTHTRTIFTMERAKKNLLDEFRAFVVPETTPKSLIDDYLEPYTLAYMKLKNSDYKSTGNAEKINGYLDWLNKCNNYDWMPPAILFMTQHQDDSEYLLWFIRKLDRLSSYLQVTAQDVNHRMARYKFVLAELKERPNSSLNDPIQNIELLIKIYKDNVLVGTYNALSSYDGWTVPLDAGVYTAVVNVKDESAVPGNATITVNKASCTITAKAVSAVYNSKKYLVITLKDAKGNPISNAEVNVNLNGVKNLKTDKNGQIKVLVGKLVPKSYTAKITFNNNNYIQTAKSVNVKVTKAKAKITAKKKTFKKSLKVKKYTITLKNGKTAIKKVKVYIKIKGKTYKATTNKKGKATFKITKLTKKGTFKSKITFKGNKYYKKVTKTVKIKIK